MFGLSAFFNALTRLTAAISRSAELFETANVRLEQQLGFEPETPLLESNGEEKKTSRAKR